MHIQKSNLTPTTIKLVITADQQVLDEVKQDVLRRIAKDLKLPGFRAGKAPAAMIEKQVDQATLQSEFLNAALNRMYVDVLNEYKLRPVAQPKVSIKKFVPFTTLEFEAEVEVIGKVTLTDYTKIKLAKKPVTVTAKDVEDVITNLQTRMADKKEVTRASKNGDEVLINFAGRDAKTNEPIKGGDGKAYPLLLGSDTFIPGFETNIVGMKAGEDKEFTITFPKDYGVAVLQNRKVTFKVTVTKVYEVAAPKVDDAFAAKVGPFKTVGELKSDIKKQITADRQNQADRDFESDLLTKITEKSQVAIPASLVDEEVERLEQEERQNVAYRGQTWQEHLDEEGVTNEQHKANNRPSAEMRVRAGLVLAEIAEKEKVQVTPDEVDIQIQLRKGQYQDAGMQAELDKPENRRELASRMLSEKTIALLVGYATKKK